MGRVIKLSIIIPTLNRPIEVERIVLELKRNNEADVEIIIVDDSKDSIEEKLKLIDTSIIYIHRGEKLGVSSARNIGAKTSLGEYLIFLDDDDSLSKSWLRDFLNSTETEADLVYCNMLSISQNGNEKRISAKENNRGIVIPGAWMIKKDVFLNVGGYDSRLKFAENTELFFRIDQIELKKVYIEKENFIYMQSSDGGSKNLKNMIDSLSIILDKHADYLNSHVKHLYHQNIGVIQMRFKDFSNAKRNLSLAIKYKPTKISTYLRYGLASVPFFASKVYSTEIKQK